MKREVERLPVKKRIEAFIHLGDMISTSIKGYSPETGNDLHNIIVKASLENPWFTRENIILALHNWSNSLKPNDVEKWTLSYLPELENEQNEFNIGVVNAGNIPLVGLHDLLSVLLCGYNYYGKNATGDTILLPFIASMISAAEPAFGNKIHFVPRLEKPDAVIATGNDNSSRYFEYYFGKYPHIIRKNRNGIAVLSGEETEIQLHDLGKDIFSFFGLGCRNVSKIYVPKGYDFGIFFRAIEDYNLIRMHNKYMNNFDYNNSIFLIKRIPFLQNGFLIVRQENQVASPVSVLHYEEYENKKELIQDLSLNIDRFQCIVSGRNIFSEKENLEKIRIDFGESQSPALWDYADRMDTVRFLLDAAKNNAKMMGLNSPGL